MNGEGIDRLCFWRLLGRSFRVGKVARGLAHRTPPINRAVTVVSSSESLLPKYPFFRRPLAQNTAACRWWDQISSCARSSRWRCQFYHYCSVRPASPREMGWEKARPEKEVGTGTRANPHSSPAPQSHKFLSSTPTPSFCLSLLCSQAPHFLKPIPPPISFSKLSERFPAPGPLHPHRIPVRSSPSTFLPATSFLLTS